MYTYKIIDKQKSETNRPFQVLRIGTRGKFPYNQYTFKTKKERQIFMNNLKGA